MMVCVCVCVGGCLCVGFGVNVWVGWDEDGRVVWCVDVG